MPRQRLKRERIVQALNELGNRAQDRGLVLDEYIERFYPGDALDLRARPVVERILARIRSEQP